MSDRDIYGNPIGARDYKFGMDPNLARPSWGSRASDSDLGSKQRTEWAHKYSDEAVKVRSQRRLSRTGKSGMRSKDGPEKRVEATKSLALRKRKSRSTLLTSKSGRGSSKQIEYMTNLAIPKILE